MFSFFDFNSQIRLYKYIVRYIDLKTRIAETLRSLNHNSKMA